MKYVIRSLFVLCLAGGFPFSVCKETFKQTLERRFKEETLRNASRLRAYSGVLRENKVYAAGPLEYQVYFRGPDRFLSRVITPGPFKGATLLFTGGQVRIYYPSTRFGIAFKNLGRVSLYDYNRYMHSMYDWYARNYRVSLGENGRVAALPVLNLRYEPHTAEPFHFRWRTFVHREFSFPLRMLAREKERLIYSYEFKKIVFNKTIPDTVFNFNFPRRATVARWDMKSRNHGLKGLRRGANFRYRLPDATMPIKRIIRVRGLVPAFTVYYEKKPFYLLYSMVKDYGIPSVPRGKGVRIGKKPGVFLNFYGPTTTVHFRSRGVIYTLIGNSPYAEMLRLADGVRKGDG